MKTINLLINKSTKLINKASRKINEIIKIRIQGAENCDIEHILPKIVRDKIERYIKHHSNCLINLEQKNLKNWKEML